MSGQIATILLLTTALAAESPKLPPNVAKTAKAARAAANAKKAKPSPVPQRAQAEPTPAQPVIPLRPSQLPSVAPRVSYQQGQLTVVAENSTIGDILSAVRTATGIRIETQGGPSGDRVAAKIGPARPREVLLSLLQGSRYDYVMLGSLNDPEQIERVLLTLKLAGGGSSSPAPQAAQQQAPQRQTDQQNDEGDFQDSEDVQDPGEPPLKGPEPAQEQQPQPQPNPQPPPPTSINPNPPLNQQQPQQTDPNGQVKTPEQLLEELRQRQKQQQQSPEQRPR